MRLWDRPALQLLLLAILGSLLVRPEAFAGASKVQAFVVDAALAGGRLRAQGQPGDLALRNASVTAVVRKSDGWLLDFWPNRPALPSVKQLGNLTAIDGLWVLHPYVHDGSAPINLTARTTEIKGDSIVASSSVGLGAGVVAIETRYTLAPDQPTLLIDTQLTHTSGGKVTLYLGDEVKWGNVDYFVEGYGRAPLKFSGKTRWVGRKGAAGDLVLSSSMPNEMGVDFKTLHYGLSPSIFTKYSTLTLLAGQSVSIKRALSYRKIDEPPAKPVASGWLEATITDEAGAPLAAKLSFRGERWQKDPNFGNDGDERGAGRFVWSGDGKFRRRLAVGKYRVMATAGIERDAYEAAVEILEGKTVNISGSLPRVVKTPGWISADLHLHQAPSVDADIAMSTRVISVAAEGVELAVASDHYAATNLEPSVRALLRAGTLATPIITMIGTELSTVGNRFGHFNVFPITTDSGMSYVNTTPKRMFADVRRVAPQALLQVNHPRFADLGYFHRYKLDPKSGRVPLVYANEYTDQFDAIEVFNGLDAVSEPRVRLVLNDWLHLLGRGHRYTATGSSDSHKLFFVDPGMPRSMIHYGSAKDDAADLNARPADIVAALKAGRVVVTDGPMLDVEIDGVGPGGSVKANDQPLEMKIRVWAAPWIDVSEVQVLLGPSARRVRYIAIASSQAPLRLETSVSLGKPGETFVIVLAKGTRPLPNVHLPGVRPLAFTNPIWISP